MRCFQAVRSTLLAPLALGLGALLSGCQSTQTTTAEPDSVEMSDVQFNGGETRLEPSRMAEAQAAAESGEYDRAIALFREILSQNPTVTTAYLGLGDIYMDVGDYASAEPNYGRAARLEPRNYDAQFGHGLALQMLKRFVDAVKAYHRALAIRPESPEANLNMATTYLQMNEPGNAQVFAEKAVEFQPDNGPAWINLGAVYDQTGQYAKAVEAYRTAMELVSPTQELRMNLVMALARDSRYQETVNAAETVNQVEPSTHAYERMGWAYFRLREYDNSAEAYRKSVELDSRNWVAWNGVGVNALNRWLLSKKRDAAARDEAGDALRQSLRINPDQQKILQLVSTYRL